MAVLPVKWHWEDALDKKNQREHDGSSTYIILESLSDNISEIQDSIYGLQKDIYKLQDDISKMSEDKVKNINNKIIEKEKEESKRSKKFNPKNIIITSGNGFVDTLMLLCIMTTEIVIGIMCALYFMRG